MKKKIAAIAVFMAIIVLPTLLWPLLDVLDKTEINENRNPAEYPTVFDNGYFAAFDKFYQDRLPLRKSMIKLYTDVELKLAQIYKNIFQKYGSGYYFVKNNVIVGEKDWLFYNGDDSVSYYSGTNLPTDAELRKMAERAEIVSNYFKSHGKEFVVYVAPNKEQIYGEYMPYGIKIESQIKRLDVMAKYFSENSDFSFVYPKQALLNAKENHQIYYRSDTHWNYAGAYYGFCELMKTLGMPYEDAVLSQTKANACDLALMLAKKDEEDIDYKATYKSQYNVSYLPKTDSEIDSMVSDNPNGKKAVIFGDSYRERFMEYVGKEFTETFVAHRRKFTQNSKFEKEFADADVVVFMSVERYDKQIFGDNGILDNFIKWYGLE